MNRAMRRREAASKKEARQRANQQIRSLLPPVFVKFDQELQESIKNDRVEPSCHSGCAACCDQMVMASISEAALIVARHREVVLDVRAKLLATEQLIRECGLPANVFNILDHSVRADRNRFLDSWYMARVPCAFLDTETKRCRVYASRPLACRAHLVVTPAEFCDARPSPDAPPGSYPQVIGYDAGEPYTAALKRIYELDDRAFGTVIFGSLPQLVLYALEGSGKEGRHAQPPTG